jgi:site-specific recombinase XerD
LHRDQRWLCPSPTGRGPITRCALWQTFKKVKGEACIKKRITPRSLRHSYATRLLDAGVELRIVQILLGHASTGTTALSTHLTEPTPADLKTVLEKLTVGL